MDHFIYVRRAGLWHRHCRQMPRAYDVEGAYEGSEGWLQNALNIVSQQISSVLYTVTTKLSIFALKHQFLHLMT